MGSQTRYEAKKLRGASSSDILRQKKIRDIFRTPILAKREAHTTQSIQNLMNTLVKKLCIPQMLPRTRSPLERLPYDIHCAILLHFQAALSCYHMEHTYPKSRDELDEMWDIPWDRNVLNRHPFYQLAATCRIMRTAVERYCKHLLLRQEGLLNFYVPDYPTTHFQWSSQAKQRRRNFEALVNKWDMWKGLASIPIDPPYRLMWVRFVYCRCMFCGKGGQRRATWQYMDWACSKCEKIRWPYMTYENAIAKTILRPLHIKNPQLVFPNSNLSPLPCAYNADNGYILLQKDVDKMVEYVREHDPFGEIANGIQKKMDSTLVIYAPDGTRIEIDTNPQVEGKEIRKRRV